MAGGGGGGPLTKPDLEPPLRPSPVQSHATPHDLAVFDELFDIAAWYTPILTDRETVPQYKDEGHVLAAIRAAKGAPGD